MNPRTVFSLIVVALVLAAVPAGGAPDLIVYPSAWRIVAGESGPVDYYTRLHENGTRFVRGRYVPPMKTAVLGYEIPEADRGRVRKVRWTWRALTLPVGGDECVSGRRDSAAVVYVTWKRGLRYYSLKYVWSTVGPKGSVCDSRRNPFVAQDTIIVESGGPLNVWKNVEIDLAKHFRHQFEGDNPNASVPDLVGLGLMTDGDETASEAAADYGQFELVR